MILRSPQKPNRSVPEVDGVGTSDDLVGHPQGQRQQTRPGVPRRPVGLPEVCLIGVDGVRAP